MSQSRSGPFQSPILIKRRLGNRRCLFARASTRDNYG